MDKATLKIRFEKIKEEMTSNWDLYVRDAYAYFKEMIPALEDYFGEAKPTPKPTPKPAPPVIQKKFGSKKKK